MNIQCSCFYSSIEDIVMHKILTNCYSFLWCGWCCSSPFSVLCVFMAFEFPESFHISVLFTLKQIDVMNQSHLCLMQPAGQQIHKTNINKYICLLNVLHGFVSITFYSAQDVFSFTDAEWKL